MALLYGASEIFVDFNSILFDTDTYVISHIYEAFKDKTDHSFVELVNYIKENNGVNFEYIGQVKNSINPLADFIENEEEANMCYYEVLYNVDIDVDIMIDELAPTDLGKSMLTLMKDENLKKLYVYIDMPTPTLCEVVYNYFEMDSRVIIVGGNKDEFLNCEEYFCDTYIFQDIKDVSSLMKFGKRKESIDVLVPEFPFNIDEETGNIYLLDDDGDEISGTQLSNDYNINISTIELPLI